MKIIFTIVLLFFCSSIGAEIRPEYSGMWYNQDQRGHGLNLEVLSDAQTVGFWYLYDEEGKPFWLLLEGINSIQNRIEMFAYHYSGMVLGEWDPNTNRKSEWGFVLIQFADCDHATVTVTQNDVEQWQWESIEMERLTHIAGLKCVDPEPESTTLEQISGDWKAWANNGTGVSIQPDGTFEYFTEYGCRFSGQIEIDKTDPTLLSLTYVQDVCINPFGPFQKSGRLYTNYLLCYSMPMTPEGHRGAADCGRSSEVMVFEPCLGDPPPTFPGSENSWCDLVGPRIFGRPF